MYQSGQGVKQDYDEALKWHRKAIAQGSAVAQNNLGEMYQWGTGVQRRLLLSTDSRRLQCDTQDGYFEIVAASNRPYGNYDNYIYVFDYQGNIREGWPFEYLQNILCSYKTFVVATKHVL